MIGLGFLFIYLVMVAQFQSLLSPFIVIFTVPLAFTGGMIGLMVFGEQLSLVSMMGFLILMGVVVNNGIVFVDYVNQLRIGGASKKEALVEAGRTRMRPILMTAMTTILAMSAMIFSKDIGSDMGRGMAIVVASGLIYATLMTVFIVPVLYDIFFRRDIKVIDVGDND
jgi:multidrug efflux pump subunit AcrB